MKIPLYLSGKRLSGKVTVRETSVKRIFDNMQVLIFCEFGLKTPIHAPKTGFWGGFDPLSGELSHRDPEKALMVAEARCMSH